MLSQGFKIILPLFICLALVGCSGSQRDDNETSEPAPAPTPVPQLEDTPPEQEKKTEPNTEIQSLPVTPPTIPSGAPMSDAPTSQPRDVDAAAVEYVNIAGHAEEMAFGEYIEKANGYRKVLLENSGMIAFSKGDENTQFQAQYREINEKYSGPTKVAMLSLLVRNYSYAIEKDPNVLAPPELFEAARAFADETQNKGESRIGYYGFAAIVAIEKSRLTEETEKLVPELYSNYAKTFNSVLPVGEVPRLYAYKLATLANLICVQPSCHELDQIFVNLKTRPGKEDKVFKAWVISLNELLGHLPLKQKHLLTLERYHEELSTVLKDSEGALTLEETAHLRSVVAL